MIKGKLDFFTSLLVVSFYELDSLCPVQLASSHMVFQGLFTGTAVQTKLAEIFLVVVIIILI